MSRDGSGAHLLSLPNIACNHARWLVVWWQPLMFSGIARSSDASRLPTNIPVGDGYRPPGQSAGTPGPRRGQPGIVISFLVRCPLLYPTIGTVCPNSRQVGELPVVELHQDQPHSIQIPMPLVRFVELIVDAFHRIVRLKTKSGGQSVSTVWEKRILLSKFLLSAVAATALGSASNAAIFEIMPDYPDIMVINGEIKESDGINFIRALVSSPTPIKLLRLNSLGGEMVAGKVIAAMTRTMMLNTLVGDKDTCASMCVLIFAAGTKRMHFSTGRDRRAFAWQLLPKTSTSRSRTTVPRPTTPTSPASSSATVRPTVSLAR